MKREGGGLKNSLKPSQDFKKNEKLNRLIEWRDFSGHTYYFI